MKARDVMVAPVICVNVSAKVDEVAAVLLKHHISAVPVVEDDNKLVGIVSEGDLIHRVEAGTERRRSWWLRLLTSDQELAADFVKSHSRNVRDVMTPDPVTAPPDMQLAEVAELLERHGIKRVPIVKDGVIVGIVSRANLVQALAAGRGKMIAGEDDSDIREKLMTQLRQQPWAHLGRINITVSDGVVDLWGIAESETERQALRVAAESTPGVRSVNDNLIHRPVETWM